MRNDQDKLKLALELAKTLRGHLSAAHAFGVAMVRATRTSDIDLGIKLDDVRSLNEEIRNVDAKAASLMEKLSYADASTEFVPKSGTRTA